MSLHYIIHLLYSSLYLVNNDPMFIRVVSCIGICNWVCDYTVSMSLYSNRVSHLCLMIICGKVMCIGPISLMSNIRIYKEKSHTIGVLSIQIDKYEKCMCKLMHPRLSSLLNMSGPICTLENSILTTLIK